MINLSSPYLTILRIDYWFKNIFMLPGVVLGLLLYPSSLNWNIILILMTGVLATCLAASANYVINEFLDAEYDQFHPVKKNRPSVVGTVTGRGVALLYIMLILTCLGFASLISQLFLIIIVVFLCAGIIYNIPPIRTKDRSYLDVISESINNPIRFLLGWAVFAGDHLPPSSILISYWAAGAFLMSIKRFAEYRYINDPQKAGQYRRSFMFYTEEKLLVSSFFYSMVTALFLGIFLIKHRIEFLLTFPFLALLFTGYLHLGMKPDSVAQNPEKLFKERGYMLYILFLTGLFTILAVVDLPWLEFLIY